MLRRGRRPKTYNARQIADLELKAAYAPPRPDTPDLTRHVRFFSHDEIRALIDLIMARVAAKPTSPFDGDISK